MFRIHSRFDAIALCEWHECTGCAESALGRDRDATSHFLGQLLSDDARRAVLRDLAHLSGDGLGLARLSTQQVIDQLVDCMTSGRLRVCGKVGVQAHESPMDLVQAMAPGGPAPAPVARSSSAPVAAAAPEPPTLPPIDAAAMAAVLVAAAEDGLPFCEICEKNKRARQPAEATA